MVDDRDKYRTCENDKKTTEIQRKVTAMRSHYVQLNEWEID